MLSSLPPAEPATSVYFSLLLYFPGAQCEENFDECQSDPCQNDAQCIDGYGQYHCQCQPGWTGNAISFQCLQCIH